MNYEFYETEESPKVLKKDETELREEGERNIEELLDVVRDDYLDKGMEEGEELDKLLSEKREELRDEFERDAFGRNEFREVDIKHGETEEETEPLDDLSKMLDDYYDGTDETSLEDDLEAQLESLEEDEGKTITQNELDEAKDLLSDEQYSRLKEQVEDGRIKVV